MKIGIASYSGSKQYWEKFGNSSPTFQQICLIEALKTYVREDEDYHLPVEVFAKKFIIWQAKPLPKAKVFDKSFSLKYNHSDDLRWNDCIEEYKRYLDYRLDEIEKFKKPEISEIIASGVDEEDPMLKAIERVRIIENE